jgi:phosphatidate cytidylyltransferase
MARAWAEDDASVLIRRILSALVLIPLVIAAVLLGGWWYAGAVLVPTAIVLYEWYRVTGAKALWAATAALIAVWVAMAYHHSIVLSLYLLIMGAIGSAFLCLVRGGEERAVWAGAGLVYVALPMMALLWLIDAAGAYWVLWLFGVVWATDSGAFAVGRLVGGPKLAPSISPRKTWAGAFGGLAGAVIVSVVLAKWLLVSVDLGHAVTLAVAASVVAQFGDLFESWVKRRFDVKDTGGIIPGHGGLMDRVDGLIPAAVVLAVIFMAHPGLVGAVP